MISDKITFRLDNVTIEVLGDKILVRHYKSVVAEIECTDPSSLNVRLGRDVEMDYHEKEKKS